MIKSPALSILVPSRQRADALKFSLASLGLSRNTTIEVLIWVDDDDLQLQKYRTYFDKNNQIKLCIRPRVGYLQFHEMMNFLTTQATGEWLMLWNDDAYMGMVNWYDTFIEYASLSRPVEEPVAYNIWGQGKAQHFFPIISKKYLEIVGHFAQNCICDSWVKHVAYYSHIQRHIFGIKPHHRKFGQDNHGGLGDLIDTTHQSVERLGAETGDRFLGQRAPHTIKSMNNDVSKVVSWIRNNHNRSLRVGFVGLGKLGLPVALAIESRGKNIVAYDINTHVSDAIRNKQIHYEEPGVENLLKKTTLELVNSVDEVVQKSNLIFCAVQTPHDARFEGDTPLKDAPIDFDYSYLNKAIKDVVKAANKLNEPTTLAVISTCLPSTYEREIKPLLSPKINYLYNPLFIAMGTVIPDFLNPEFVLIGTSGGDTTPLTNFYKMILGVDKAFITDITTAEGIKVLYNTFITTKTVLGNMYGEFAHKIGMNVDHIYEALSKGTNRLMSPMYLKSGVADGGGCLPAGEMVMTKMGMKPIETITIGEYVLTAKGRFRKVLKLWERHYEGNLIKVTVRGLPPARMTVEHPVLVRRDGRHRVPDGRRNTLHKILDALSEVKKVRADRLNLDSLIGFPIIKEKLNEIVSHPFVELAGWYLSEGSVELSKRRGRLRFDLHAREEDDGERIVALIGMCAYPKHNNRGNNVKVSHKVEGNKRSVRFGDKNLATYLVSNFGKGAKDKFIPDKILWGDLEQAKLLLKGLIRGDGHRGENGISYSTISRDLAWGVFILLHRLELNPTLREIPARGIHKPSFEVRVRNRRLASNLCKVVGWKSYAYGKNIQTYAVDTNGIWRHIQKLEKEPYKGKVYNLWVDKDNTFITKCGAVHNCHPRDNIALSFLANKVGMSFNYFDALMTARENHMAWLADLFIEQITINKLPGIIFGKSFKPESNIQTGSPAHLLANIVKYKGVTIDHFEFDYPRKLTVAVYMIATRHGHYATLRFPKGSIVIDPFRYITQQEGVNIFSIGAKK